MNIIPKLSLNKHPKDSDNMSLVNALNVKISNDNSCITNEESIKENEYIKNKLIEYYKEDEFKIISIIPCNVELVIIAVNTKVNNKAEIFRYHEQTVNHKEDFKLAYGKTEKLDYHNGKIKGTFTYNVEGSLIIAIAEYDGTERVPLRTINLGNFDDETIYNDTNNPNSLLSLTPEINIPSFFNLEYIAGSAYKGWYYLFIRYKINTVDYTQWYNFGYPIYVDTLEQFQIIRYCYNRKTHLGGAPMVGPDVDTSDNILYPDEPNDGYGAGCSDYFSNKTDIANETFKVNIANKNDKYKYYQIGIVCVSKGYTKAYRTADIINTIDNKTFIFDIKTLIETSATELIRDNYNYFNVKNIINYKNRLYISNYEENNLNTNVDKSIIDNIDVKLHTRYIVDKGLVYDQCIIRKDDNTSNQYDVYKWPRIPLDVYLGVNKNIKVVVKYEYGGTENVTDDADKFFLTCTNKEGKEVNRGNLVIGHFKNIGAGNYDIEYLKASIFEQNYFIEFPNSNLQPIRLTRNNYALQSGREYINTNISFNERKLNSTLIPGEVYNFFIHFVDKYGHSTNGYRIDNKYKITIEGFEEEVIPFKIKVALSSGELNLIATVPINQNLLNLNKLNISNIKFFKTLDETNFVVKDEFVSDSITMNNVLNTFKNLFSCYENNKYKDFKWYQVVIPANKETFSVYINNNGDRLFKVPFNKSFISNYIFDYNVKDIRELEKLHTIYNISFENITIPDNYVGYFISYEEFEPMQRATGLLTRNDFRNQDYVINAIHETANTKKSNKMLFYSSVFDISDKIKLDYNIFRIEGVNVYNKEDIPEYDYMQRNTGFNFMHDMNKPQINEFDAYNTYAMPDYKVAVADSSIDNRMGLGTCLQIEDKYNLFPTYTTTAEYNNKIKLYRVTLLNSTRNIYLSNNKNLIRLTDIIYKENKTPVISRGLNGHITYDNVLIYENAGMIFNEADFKVRKFNINSEYYNSIVPEDTPHTYQNDVPFVMYLQTPIYSDIFFESKSFKNEPKGIVYFVKFNKDDASKNKFWSGCMVTPPNSIDLFENKQGSVDKFTIKSYTNYRKDLVSIDKFDKTVRRSAVIKDESRVNNWRIFDIDSYKNITENKGNITNLVGVGYIFLVHTEHSLFMFDTNNLIQADNKDIQINQTDVFDVAYKEVFTSTLGFGGLQDDKSYIIDKFGYIYYNNDSNRFYRFDNGQLIIIDNDIVQWLNKYKPYNVRFANDKLNNRLIIKMNYKVNSIENTITISYNYILNTFISLHSYYFDEAYNTKNKLYFKCNENHIKCSLHNFITDGSSYGKFDNTNIKLKIASTYPSKISIIANNDYETIKFINYITYKLHKYINGVNVDYTNSPVEETKEPFSGNYISIYNDIVNTGKLDIAIDKEEAKNIFANYIKPYWELGNWNFNYIRNNSDKNISAYEMSRIFGNYFIIEFTFTNEDELKVEFESLDYNISVR